MEATKDVYTRNAKTTVKDAGLCERAHSADLRLRMRRDYSSDRKHDQMFK